MFVALSVWALVKRYNQILVYSILFEHMSNLYHIYVFSKTTLSKKGDSFCSVSVVY